MKIKRLPLGELEEIYTPQHLLALLQSGHTIIEIAEMMTRSRSHAVRVVRSYGLSIPTKSHTDAYALMCHEYGLNAAEFLRARDKDGDKVVVSPVRYKLLSGQELVFQPGVARSARHFLHKDFLERTLPIGFSATLFQRLCKGYTMGKAFAHNGDEGYMDWLVDNNNKSMAHIYKLVMGKIPKEWG